MDKIQTAAQLLLLVAKIMVAEPQLLLFDQYTLQNACEESYGAVVATWHTRSIVDCACQCSRAFVCSSFIYNSTSLACTLNSDVPGQLSTDCSETMVYGTEIQISKAPTSTSPISNTLSTTSPTSTTPTTTTPTTTTPMPVVACETNVDCTAARTECRNAYCQCERAYVFHYGHANCTFIQDCVYFESTFQSAFIDEEYRDTPYAIIDTTEPQCMTECLAMSNCKLIQYYLQQSECMIFTLNTDNEAVILDYFEKENKNNVYQRDCLA